MEWPRLARFDKHPPFGIYQKAIGAPIEIVKCGEPPIFFATIRAGELQTFCQVFGLDYPAGQFNEEASDAHRD